MIMRTMMYDDDQCMIKFEDQEKIDVNDNQDHNV